MGVLSLIARLSLNASGFELGLKRSQSLVDRWGRDVSGSVKSYLAAAFGGAAILSATKNAIDYAGKIDDLSTRLGIGTQALQEFDYAARQNGSTLEDFTSVLQKLAATRAQALQDPAGEMADSFARLGVSAQDLKDKKLEELLRQIGSAFEKASSPQKLFNSALDTMGRGSTAIFPALISGLSDSAEAANQLGAIIEDSVIDRLQAVGDQLEDLQLQFRAVTAEGAAGFLSIGKTVYQVIGTQINRLAGWLTGYANFSDPETIAKLADEMGEDFMADQITKEQEVVRMRDRRNKRQSNFDFDFSDVYQKPATLKMIQAKTNSLQEVGAYIGINPMTVEQKVQTNLLRQIEKNTKDTANKEGIF